MKNEMDLKKVNIGVVGAGSWGTALADLLGRKGLNWICGHLKKKSKNRLKPIAKISFFFQGFPFQTIYILQTISLRLFLKKISC